MNWYLAVLKNYAGFKGRARRKEYWMFNLINVVVALVLGGIGFAIDPTVGMALYGVYLLGTLIPSLAVLIRRLHDTGRSGAWFFIGLVPFVGGIILLVFTATEGTRDHNAYGPDPKAQPALV
ncbi:DUF805 domain-containing protein [Streptomyces sp. NPDC060194]|uniref:DUF805 domain-containing protein n=1 Tax=Streptomyces sp. NPDC060194 TaxID=3347069 RepID=UPI003666502A